MHSTDALTAAEFEALLTLARDAVVRVLLPAATGAPPVLTARCTLPGACFVTLRRGTALRGCIGSLEPRRALHEDVVANAWGAAFRDPRFAPLDASEVPGTTLDISVLAAPRSLVFSDEDEFYTLLVPGEDGLIIAHQGRRATFLPSVWAQLPEPRRFVAELRRKAGIAADVPLTALSVQRYATAHSPTRALA